MTYREAEINDINQIHNIRVSVSENKLSNPDLVTYEHYIDFMTQRGKGWVCEIENQIVGFVIVDLNDRNVWALFVNPKFENKGIGKQLQKMMLDWYFNQTKDTIWLGTDPNTRAERFYRKSSWTEIGTYGNGEIKFEMTYKNWNK